MSRHREIRAPEHDHFDDHNILLEVPMRAVSRGLVVSAFTAALLSVGVPAALRAQGGSTPKVVHACFIPATGTVYRIKEPGLSQACTAKMHVEFSWTDGAGAVRAGDAAGGDLSGTYPNPTVAKLQGRAVAGTAPGNGQVLTWDATTSSWRPAAPGSGGDHGQLTGLGDDDHTQYLLANGVRRAQNGFAVSGDFSIGQIPATGAGVRVMWYPAKVAFRAGQAWSAEWDDANIGVGSTATGLYTTASGTGATAMGFSTTASGSSAIALGNQTTASGNQATALGFNTTASGDYSTALGQSTTASATGATALGRATTASGLASVAMGQLASTNGHPGSFVFGDVSTGALGPVVSATAANQFVVRAAGGFRLRTSSDLSSGCDIFGGNLTCTGTVTSASDVALKERFELADAEDALTKLAALRIQRWSYKADSAGVRHVGPTAQDFRAAFGLGMNDKTISMVDADGINMLAIQALERRPREIAALRRENAELRARLERLEAAVARLTHEPR